MTIVLQSPVKFVSVKGQPLQIWFELKLQSLQKMVPRPHGPTSTHLWCLKQKITDGQFVALQHYASFRQHKCPKTGDWYQEEFHFSHVKTWSFVPTGAMGCNWWDGVLSSIATLPWKGPTIQTSRSGSSIPWRPRLSRNTSFKFLQHGFWTISLSIIVVQKHQQSSHKVIGIPLSLKFNKEHFEPSLLKKVQSSQRHLAEFAHNNNGNLICTSNYSHRCSQQTVVSKHWHGSLQSLEEASVTTNLSTPRYSRPSNGDKCFDSSLKYSSKGTEKIHELSLGGGKHDEITKQVEQLLSIHGVFEDRVVERSQMICSKIPSTTMRSILAAPRAWQDLKQAANGLNPPIRLIQSDELQKQIEKRAEGVKKVGHKQGKQTKGRQREQRDLLEIQVSDVEVPLGVFKQHDGQMLKQLSPDQIGPHAQGVMLLDQNIADSTLRLPRPVTSKRIRCNRHRKPTKQWPAFHRTD